MRYLPLLAILTASGCLTGCKVCGEYRVEGFGQNIVLGPGDGQCTSVELEKPLMDYFFKPKDPEPPDPKLDNAEPNP